ncbi:MAG: PAS domain-containing protein [Nitrospirae bacterium]|nr:PAS domain-containing protein [Nitrospirota bacterium]
MKIDMIFFYSLVFTLIVLILAFFYLLKTFRRIYNRQKNGESKEVSQVGFVVDTFHELVSKLKEKERELEILRQKAEDRALTIEGYNENILQSVPSGVMSFDENLKITKVNQTAEKIFEIKKEFAFGKYHTDVLNSPITDLLNEKKIIERGEIAYTTPSGRKIWLGLNLSPLKDSDGKIIGQILVFTDITEIKALEAQMEFRSRLSSLGEISAGIAHELRNPMGVIAGYTKLLSKKVDVSLKPAVNAIINEINVMNRIISDFLSFAKPAELNVSDVDLKAVIEKSITEVSKGREDIKTHIEIDKLPLIKGDEVLLRQAFTNLIQNAIESMPAGGEIYIRSSIGDSVELFISDTGPGIAENIIDKIFLPFFTTKEGGTGLGLSIVQKVIVSHGGNIFVESNNKGTTFRIRLPIKK